MHKERSRLILILLMILGGVGYLYISRPARFIAYQFAILITFIIDYYWIGEFFSTPLGLFSLITIFFIIILISICDGLILVARNQPYEITKLNRWWIYIGACILILAAGTLWHPEWTGKTSKIASSSMAPTLLVGDYIISDTRAYAAVLPERGDVVLYRRSGDVSSLYVGRIIGLPGETIRFANQIPSIDQVPIKRVAAGNIKFTTSSFSKSAGKLIVNPNTEVSKYREFLSNGSSYEIIEIAENTPADNTDEFQIEADDYFIVGDNRDNSYDSRFNVGKTSRNDVLAKVKGIYWSGDLSRIGLSITPQN